MADLITLLSDIPFTKILAYFGYTIAKESEGFVVFERSNYAPSFLLYLTDSETPALFSTRSMRPVNKVEAIQQISPRATAAYIIGCIEEISDAAPLTYSSVLGHHTPTSALDFVCALHQPIQPNAILESEQYRGRVFMDDSRKSKTLLRQFDFQKNIYTNIVNVVTWDEDSISYLNEMPGMTSTNFIEENQYISFFCTPQSWLLLPEYVYGPEYLTLLFHPNWLADKDVPAHIATLKGINTIRIPVTTKNTDNVFSFRYLFYRANQHSPIQFNVYDGTGLCIELIIPRSNDQIKKAGSFLNEWQYTHGKYCCSNDQDLDATAYFPLLRQKENRQHFLVHRFTLPHQPELLSLFGKFMIDHHNLTNCEMLPIIFKEQEQR